MNKNSKSIVVYTALFGNYDCLIDPREAYEGCDFICFTDQDNLETKIWEQVKVSQSFPSPTAANRHFKWLPHRYLDDYEVSLYLDSNILLYVDPKDLIEKYLTDADIAMPRHVLRDCLYDEATACICLNKVGISDIYSQIVSYRRSGVPRHIGLAEQGIILRRHNSENVIRCMETTWDELIKWGNYRDQLAFPYVAWKLSENISLMDEYSRDYENFIHLPHTSTPDYWQKGFLLLRFIKRLCVDAQILKLLLMIKKRGY